MCTRERLRTVCARARMSATSTNIALDMYLMSYVKYQPVTASLHVAAGHDGIGLCVKLKFELL